MTFDKRMQPWFLGCLTDVAVMVLRLVGGMIAGKGAGWRGEAAFAHECMADQDTYGLHKLEQMSRQPT